MNTADIVKNSRNFQGYQTFQRNFNQNSKLKNTMQIFFEVICWWLCHWTEAFLGSCQIFDVTSHVWEMFKHLKYTAQKMKFAIKDFCSKCDQICRKLRIWSHLLKKSLMENFVFCAVVSFVLITWQNVPALFKSFYYHMISLVFFALAAVCR